MPLGAGEAAGWPPCPMGITSTQPTIHRASAVLLCSLPEGPEASMTRKVPPTPWMRFSPMRVRCASLEAPFGPCSAVQEAFPLGNRTAADSRLVYTPCPGHNSTETRQGWAREARLSRGGVARHEVIPSAASLWVMLGASSSCTSTGGRTLSTHAVVLMASWRMGLHCCCSPCMCAQGWFSCIIFPVEVFPVLNRRWELLVRQQQSGAGPRPATTTCAGVWGSPHEAPPAAWAASWF